MAVLSSLGFAGAEPFRMPLVKKRDPISAEEWGIAADALRSKYGYPPPHPQNARTPPLSRSSTRSVLFAPGSPRRLNGRVQNRDTSYLGVVRIGTPYD